jgi:VanZ family protein
MVVIFSASGDTHSFQHSSRIIAPLVNFFFPNISPEALDRCVLVARKCAHLSEYAILALLFWRAARKPVWGDKRPWSWELGVGAILFVALYASTDEFHQRFVPSREASPVDVMIDTTGAMAGIGMLWVQGRLRRRW